MAVSVGFTSVRSKHVAGDLRVSEVTLTFSGSYAAGGETLSAQAVGLGTIEVFVCPTASDGTNGLVPYYNHSTGKLQLFTAHGTPGATVALIEYTAGDLSSFVARAIVFGK